MNTFTDSTKQTSCQICPNGRVSKTGSASCSSCAAGKFKKADDTCVACPSGYHTSDSDTLECIQCGIGIKGETSIEGSSVCSLCDLGKYQTTPGVCTDCPPGRYQDGKGSKQCLECPKDTYLAAPGKSSKADCIKCDRDRSTGSSIGNVNNAACLCKRTDYYQSEGKCLNCPPGADCSAKDGMIASDLEAKVGYWRAFPDSIEFTDCATAFKKSLDPKKDAEERCPGSNETKRRRRRRLGKNINNSFDPNDQCKQNEATGDFKAIAFGGPVCQTCLDEGYTGKECGECKGGSSLASMFSAMCSVMFLLLLLFTLLFMKTKIEDETNKKKKNKQGCCGGSKERLVKEAMKMEQGIAEEALRQEQAMEKKMEEKVHHKKENKNETTKKKSKMKRKQTKQTKQEKLEGARGSTAVRRLVGDQMLLGRVSDSSAGNGTFRNDTQVIMDRIKIFYGWLQIFTALTITFEIAWPIQLRTFSMSMGFINFDVSNLLSESACSFAVPFLDTMTVHLAVPLMLLITIVLSRIPAHFLRKKHRSKQRGLMVKLIASLALILYPGLCTRLFSSLKTVVVYGLKSDTHSGKVSPNKSFLTQQIYILTLLHTLYTTIIHF